MVLPAGFSLPPLPYLGALVLGVTGVGTALYRRRPAVTEPLILGLVPWIMVGAALHVLYQIGMAPPILRPFFGTPAVYLTTFVLAGGMWLIAGDRAPLGLGVTGSAAFLGIVAIAFAGRSISPGWPVVGLGLSAIVAGGVWIGLRRLRPRVGVTGWVGVLVLFAHTVDGISTAIGVDVLGFGERTPASRLVLDLAGMLPTADLLGVGWLFVLVKVAVASLVVWLFADYVQEDERQGLILLTLIAALGLGPGIHNLLLYTVA